MKGCPMKSSRGDPGGKRSSASTPGPGPLGSRTPVVVAVFNLNVVPSIAANGGVTVWLWIISLILFFWPQGIAVIELLSAIRGKAAFIYGPRKSSEIFTASSPVVLLDETT